MFLDGFSRQSLTLLPANAQLSAENDRCLQSSTGSEAASTVDVEDGARVCNPKARCGDGMSAFCLSASPGMSLQSGGQIEESADARLPLSQRQGA